MTPTSDALPRWRWERSGPVQGVRIQLRLDAMTRVGIPFGISDATDHYADRNVRGWTTQQLADAWEGRICTTCNVAQLWGPHFVFKVPLQQRPKPARRVEVKLKVVAVRAWRKVLDVDDV